MIQLHATTVGLGGRGLVILGPSGTGKSTLALEMMAVGAALVADDRTDLRLEGAELVASVPKGLEGRIEARGVGILEAEFVPAVTVSLVCDLGQVEDQRLPPMRHTTLMDMRLPLVLGPHRPHLYAALRQLLLGARHA